jgi:hypothetical protein
MRSEILKMLNEGNIPLKATQNKICVPIVERMYKKMKAGIGFSGILVCDGVITNGHHRYIASLLSECPIEHLPWEKAKSRDVCSWNNVILIEDDYETEADILKHNEDDAKYNNITIKELVAILG